MDPKTFKARTAKQVLSQISRDLGPDVVIISHRKTQDSDGITWVEAIASLRTGKASSARRPYSTKKFFASASVLIALITAGVLIWQLLLKNPSANPLPQKLSIAVISFENQTEDHSYDHLKKIIPNLLITNLEQSGHFHVTSWERLHDLLEQMGRKEQEPIDKDLGFELCKRDGIDAMVAGSFTKAGDTFATDVKVLDARTKKILRSASSKGKGEESILKSQIDELSREISQGMGISESQSEGVPTRVADVTTNSLDAYYYYLRGQECYFNENFMDARKFYEKAIELDSGFAMAHFELAYILLWFNEVEASDEAYKKAMHFSERATEKERLYIHGMCALWLEKDTEESFRIFKKMERLFPKEKDVHYGLGCTYRNKELFTLAIEEFNKALELDPNNGDILVEIASTNLRLGNYEKAVEYYEKLISISYAIDMSLEMMAEAYLMMGKLDEAMAKYNESLEVETFRGTNWKISYISALKEDYPEALRWIDRSINDAVPVVKEWMNFVKCFYLYWCGSLDKCMNSLTREKVHKANASWMMGWISYDRGEYDSCQRHFNTWYDIYMQEVLPRRTFSGAKKRHWTAWYNFYLGLVDVKQGKIESAKSRLDEIRSLLPDVLPRFQDWVTYYYNYLQAEIYLEEGALEKAIATCEKSPPLGWSVESFKLLLHNVPFLKDVLARAYRQNGDNEKAISEYERLIIFDPQREERYLIHPKYYYRLAELYDQMGLREKAIIHYERFLKLWQEADPYIPEVIEANERLLFLQGKP